MKNRKREICTSGSVRDEDGQPPHLLGRRNFLHLAASAAELKFSTELRDYGPVCGKQATLLGDADEIHRMGGTGQAAGMLRGQVFGPGGNTTPE